MFFRRKAVELEFALDKQEREALDKLERETEELLDQVEAKRKAIRELQQDGLASKGRPKNTALKHKQQAVQFPVGCDKKDQVIVPVGTAIQSSHRMFFRRKAAELEFALDKGEREALDNRERETEELLDQVEAKRKVIRELQQDRLASKGRPDKTGLKKKGPAVQFPVGSKVLVLWEGGWWKGIIDRHVPGGEYQVSYPGWKGWTETVDGGRLKPDKGESAIASGPSQGMVCADKKASRKRRVAENRKDKASKWPRKDKKNSIKYNDGQAVQCFRLPMAKRMFGSRQFRAAVDTARRNRPRRKNQPKTYTGKPGNQVKNLARNRTVYFALRRGLQREDMCLEFQFRRTKNPTTTQPPDQPCQNLQTLDDGGSAERNLHDLLLGDLLEGIWKHLIDKCIKPRESEYQQYIAGQLLAAGLIHEMAQEQHEELSQTQKPVIFTWHHDTKRAGRLVSFLQAVGKRTVFVQVPWNEPLQEGQDIFYDGHQYCGESKRGRDLVAEHEAWKATLSARALNDLNNLEKQMHKTCKKGKHRVLIFELEPGDCLIFPAFILHHATIVKGVQEDQPGPNMLVSLYNLVRH